MQASASVSWRSKQLNRFSVPVRVGSTKDDIFGSTRSRPSLNTPGSQTLRGVNFRDDIRVVVVININASTFYSLVRFIVSLAIFYIELLELFTADRSTYSVIPTENHKQLKTNHIIYIAFKCSKNQLHFNKIKTCKKNYC